jgi:putative DNA primase/helicase
VDRLRHAEKGLFDDLVSRLARWADDNREVVRLARPDIPAQLNDRAQDNWEPLLAIADVAGGKWPDMARQAALSVSGATGENATIGNELLADIRDVFETKKVDRLSTADLINALCADDERSWATYNRGKPITPKQMARRLHEYGIASKNLYFSPSYVPKGYEREQFDDVFARYLSHPKTQIADKETPSGIANSETPSGYEKASAMLKPNNGAAHSGIADAGGGNVKMCLTK